MSFQRPIVMGILNLTPDSFHDGGEYNSEAQSVLRAEQLLSEGAEILDLGAASSRPGAQEVSTEEELTRLLPSLRGIKKAFPEILISVDTYRSEVAKQALDEGADLINDISGGILDDQLPKVCAVRKAPYICMHMNGTPDTMQKDLQEGPITADVLKFFDSKLRSFRDSGLNDVIIDPGFGFGKTVAQNFELARNLESFQMLAAPILVGVSRKSMINKTLGTKPSEALNGTTALHMALLERGADILRVHDVKEAAETVKLYEALHSN